MRTSTLSRSRASLGSEVTLEASALDRAYVELDGLFVLRHTEGPSPELNERIKNAWQTLDSLHAKETRKVIQALDSTLEVTAQDLRGLLREPHIGARARYPSRPR